jgi:hypothetical protein
MALAVGCGNPIESYQQRSTPNHGAAQGRLVRPQPGGNEDDDPRA